MPIAFDPATTTEFCLESDKSRPAELRAYFKSRFLTCRQFQEVRSKLELASNATADSEMISRLLDALRVGIISWRLVEKSGTVDDLPDILTVSELWELATEFRNAVSISEVDLKKSALQPA